MSPPSSKHWSRWDGELAETLTLTIAGRLGNAKLAETFAKELAAPKPDILVINSTASVIAARRHAGTIPIVMAAVADPVAQGFVQSLERPGGTITGFAAAHVCF